jgi:protein TonB
LRKSHPDKPQVVKLKIQNEDIKNRRHQIVQSENSENSLKKEDAFLSDKTRSFDRESIARNVEKFSSAKGGGGAPSQASENLKSNAGKLKNLRLKDLAGHHQEVLSDTQSVKKISAAQTGQDSAVKDQPGLSSTNDYVQEVSLGDFTQLNTVEYKFYGFYHRIRQKLEQFWGKSIQEKSMLIFRSGRKIASADYITSLQVSMNHRGEIVAVKILGASGVKELDDAAVESFNAAGPFPNPPKELLINGTATIEWGFVVKSS